MTLYYLMTIAFILHIPYIYTIVLFTAKFFGTCNEQKFALDRCFKDEKNVKRAENLAKARDFDKKWESGAFDDKTK